MTDTLLSRPFVNRMGLRPGIPTIRSIQIEHCERNGISLEQLLGRGKTRRVVLVRQQAYHDCMMRTEASLTTIGNAFKRCHDVIYRGARAYLKRVGGSNQERMGSHGA